MLPFYEYMFTFKCVKIDKRFKSLNKDKKYNLVFKFLKSTERIYHTIRFLYLLSDNFKRFKLSERILLSLIDTFFLLKDSLIYKQKLLFYKRVLKKFKKY